MTKKRNPEEMDSSLFVYGITLTFSMKSAKIKLYIIMKSAVLCTNRGKQSNEIVLFGKGRIYGNDEKDPES